VLLISEGPVVNKSTLNCLLVGSVCGICLTVNILYSVTLVLSVKSYCVRVTQTYVLVFQFEPLMISNHHHIEPEDGGKAISLNLTRFCTVFSFLGTCSCNSFLYNHLQVPIKHHKRILQYKSHAFLSEKCVKLQNTEICVLCYSVFCIPKTNQISTLCRLRKITSSEFA